MRALSYLLSDFIGLVLVIFGGQAEVWAQTASLNWRIFEVSEYGTRVDYPARIFAPAGEPEKGIGQRFESADGSAVLSVYSCDNPASITSGSLDLSLPFRWNALEGSFIADAISRALRKVRSIVSILYIRKRKSGRGILW